jgi:hypothetical protein
MCPTGYRGWSASAKSLEHRAPPTEDGVQVPNPWNIEYNRKFCRVAFHMMIKWRIFISGLNSEEVKA